MPFSKHFHCSWHANKKNMSMGRYEQHEVKEMFGMESFIQKIMRLLAKGAQLGSTSEHHQTTGFFSELGQVSGPKKEHPAATP